VEDVKDPVPTTDDVPAPSKLSADDAYELGYYRGHHDAAVYFSTMIFAILMVLLTIRRLTNARQG
jgi:hypothetical protein